MKVDLTTEVNTEVRSIWLSQVPKSSFTVPSTSDNLNAESSLAGVGFRLGDFFAKHNRD